MCCFTFYEDKPTARRLTISNTLKSSMKLNLSDWSTLSAQLFDWDRYSKIPSVAPAGPPPLIILASDWQPRYFTDI